MPGIFYCLYIIKSNHFRYFIYHLFTIKKASDKKIRSFCRSSGELDSNQRPLAPHTSALPGCATTRTINRVANVTDSVIFSKAIFIYLSLKWPHARTAAELSVATMPHRSYYCRQPNKKYRAKQATAFFLRNNQYLSAILFQ
ncbi:MAG: hypothetical protein RLZZ316_2581 [Bacteroidota bacterium]